MPIEKTAQQKAGLLFECNNYSLLFQDNKINEILEKDRRNENDFIFLETKMKEIRKKCPHTSGKIGFRIGTRLEEQKCGVCGQILKT